MFPALYQFVALHVRAALVASPCRLLVVVVRLVTLCCCGDGCRTRCSDRVGLWHLLSPESSEPQQLRPCLASSSAVYSMSYRMFDTYIEY